MTARHEKMLECSNNYVRLLTQKFKKMKSQIVIFITCIAVTFIAVQLKLHMVAVICPS